MIKSLGKLEKWDDGKPDFSERLKKAFKNGEIVIEGVEYKSKLVSITFNPDEGDFIMNLKNVGYFLLDVIYSNLGIYAVLYKDKRKKDYEFDVFGLTKLPIYQRILNQSSKIST